MGFVVHLYRDFFSRNYASAMLNKIEGVHVVFLRQVTVMKAQRIGYETWTKEGPDRVLQAAGTNI